MTIETTYEPWRVTDHPFYADIIAALKSGENLDGALIKAQAILTDCRDHDFSMALYNAGEWEIGHAHDLIDTIKTAAAKKPVNMDTELRKDAEWRSTDDGDTNGLSWGSIARDGRHGRGHEL